MIAMNGTIPYDLSMSSDTTERALLSAVLNDPNLIVVSSDHVQACDFEAPRYSRIFAAMVALSGQAIPPDMTLLRANYPEIDSDLLLELFTEHEGPVYVESYARAVAKASRARQMQDAGAEIVREASRGNIAGVRALNARLDALARADLDQPQAIRFDTINASALAQASLPAPGMLIDGVLPVGFSLLVGRAKIGKSFVALNLALAVASGGKALGRADVLPGSVLCLALEDSARRLQDRMRTMLAGSPPPSRLMFATHAPRADDGGIAAIETWISEHADARLVIVDTLGRFRSSTNGGKTNAFDADYQAMIDLKAICDRHPHVSLLAVHHQNKKLDHADLLDSVSGTAAVAAGPDTLLIFERKRGELEGTLYLRGRDIEERDLGLNFDPVNMLWGITGTADEARLGQGQRAIVAALTELNRDATTKEIMDVLERVGESARVSTQNQLRKLVTAGVLLHTNGKYRVSKMTTL